MRRFAIATGIVVAIGLCLAWQGGPVFDGLIGLAFGWLAYPARILPRVKIAWEGVATAALCLVLFTVGLHWTLVWLHGEIQQASAAAVGSRRRWSVRGTISLVALIVVMFIAGISATGVVHQAGWLIASRRNLVEVKPQYSNSWGSSINHLREIGLSEFQFLTVRGLFTSDPTSSRIQPSAPDAPETSSGKTRVVRQSWMTEILPYTGFMVGGDLSQDRPWNDPRNSAYFKGIVPLYLNPEIVPLRNFQGYALGHYAGNVHLLGEPLTERGTGIGDASHTILAGEVAEGFKPWGDPSNLRDPGLGVNTVSGGFGGTSGSGAYLVFVDGSVRFFENTTSRDVLRRLSRIKPSGP